MAERPPVVSAWHRVVETGDIGRLDDLLDDDVEFRSPAVFTPAPGKVMTTAYLAAALHVLGPSLRYRDEWYGPSSAVLEFEAELDGVFVQGVDLLRWGDHGRLTSFTVMVRPLRGLQQLITLMGRQLAPGGA
jgi:hypothetical protein